jgi:site-specific recombinase XerD
MARFIGALYREAASRGPRRTLITRLAERGIDLNAIAELAGHASIRTTAVYVEANPARLTKILQDVRW